MSIVRIRNEPAFYIEKVGDSIVVVAIRMHPFEYPHELGKALSKVARTIKSDKVPVYLDMTSLYGHKKLFKFFYLKATDNVETLSEITAEHSSLSADIQSAVDRILSAHR